MEVGVTARLGLDVPRQFEGDGLSGSRVVLPEAGATSVPGSVESSKAPSGGTGDGALEPTVSAGRKGGRSLSGRTHGPT